VSAHASASHVGATSSIFRPKALFGGGLIALLTLAAWLGGGTGKAGAAAECPNEAIRIAQGATRLPDCRAYERVSPADSTGGVVGLDSKNRLLVALTRADGNAAMFGSSSAVGDASERGGLRTFNLAHRSATGWSSFGVLTTTEGSVPMDISMGPAWPLPSSDMTRMMFSTSRSLGPPNPITSGGSIYLSAPEGKGAPTWMSRWASEGTQPNPPTNSSIPLGGAPDLSSGYFRYATPLTSLAGDNLRTSLRGIYYFEGETVTPAGVLPSGLVSPNGAFPAGAGNTSNTSGTGSNLPDQARNQVSADGSRLFFVSPADGAEPKQLYVQDGDAPGRLISRDVSGNPAANGITELKANPAIPTTGRNDPIQRAGYAYATPDGSRVLFLSTSALTEDAPAEGLKTYRAEIGSDSIEVEYLPAANGYPVAIDDDASTIVFSTVGSDANLSNVYLWDESRPGGAPYTIATDLSGTHSAFYDSTLSEDGSVLVFASSAELEPGMVPLPEYSIYTQIYRWTKQSETSTCISCRRDGGTPARLGSRLSSLNGLPTDSPAYVPGKASPDFSNQSSVVGNRKISRDGSRVFFDTNDPLDPARDVNGTRDVYMWEDGQVDLLTSGRGQSPSVVIDNSESGDDVMVITADGLIPSDTNQTYDVYDIRVGGGFDETAEAGCEGDACQAPSAGARSANAPGSVGLFAAGNQQQTRLGQVKVAQLGRPGTSARVRVNVPAAGRVKLAGNLVKNKARGAKAKGAVTLQVALNGAGKRKLAAKGQLSTKVTTTFRDGDGRTKQGSVTLRFKQGAN
jgi:hypothetical protein